MPRTTACRRGHAYTPENTYEQPGPGGTVSRVCRTCRALHGQPAGAGYAYQPRVMACPRGHVYTPETTRLHRLHTGRRQRVCLVCRRAQLRAFRERHRQPAAH